MAPKTKQKTQMSAVDLRASILEAGMNSLLVRYLVLMSLTSLIQCSIPRVKSFVLKITCHLIFTLNRHSVLFHYVAIKACPKKEKKRDKKKSKKKKESSTSDSSNTSDSSSESEGDNKKDYKETLEAVMMMGLSGP